MDRRLIRTSGPDCRACLIDISHRQPEKGSAMNAMIRRGRQGRGSRPAIWSSCWRGPTAPVIEPQGRRRIGN